MDDTLPSPRGLQAVVLVVDDEPDLLELVSLTLNRMNLKTRTAADFASAQRLLKAERFDLCLTDMRLPDGDGLDLVAWIQENRASVPVAVITAHGNVESAVRALKLGAFDFVSKPLDLGVLRKLVGSAIKLGAVLDEATASTLRGPRLLGSSAAMEQLREMIGRVARSQAPVHICGESGTGKELVARMIHESGGRRGGPFVAVNCGAIPTELMESEFFGHKRGAFTGAVADKKGLTQSAEGGTLFLDEVADLPLHMQVKLLRVVQEKTIRPVGEAREETVDVRILSATHKILRILSRKGSSARIFTIASMSSSCGFRHCANAAGTSVRSRKRSWNAWRNVRTHPRQASLLTPLRCCRLTRFRATCGNSKTYLSARSL